MILGSIKDNLKYGKKDATDEDLREALTKANALFAYELGSDLNTYTGSASVMNLSGG